MRISTFFSCKAPSGQNSKKKKLRSSRLSPLPGPLQREREQKLSANHGCCSTSSLDLLTRALRETVRRNLQRLGNFAISKHHDIVLGFFDQASFVQDLGRHLVILAEAFVQRLQTDFDPLLLENVGKAALRKTPVQRHLAALETGL